MQSFWSKEDVFSLCNNYLNTAQEYEESKMD